MRSGDSHRAPARRGSVYVMVLAAGVALTAMGIAGLALVRSQRDQDELRASADAARSAARAGLQAGAGLLAADPAGSSWRVGANRTVISADVGGVTLRVTASDPADADLADSNTESVRLVAEATRGAARQTYQCLLNPGSESLPILSCAAWFNGAATLKDTVIADGVIGGNASITASGAKIYAPVSAPTITGSTYYRLTRSGGAVETFPGAAAVSAWAARGTPIAYASTSGQVRRCLLSAGVNPYGALNAAGVYVIDCRGAALTIEDCRIRGTLVVLNAGSGTRLHNAVFIEGVPGQPALIVDGPLDLEQDSSDLTESSATVNLNPPGTPYLGQTDADKTDSYPSVVEGVMLVTGNVQLKSGGTLTVEGVLLVGGTFQADGKLVVRRVTPETPIEGFSRVSRLSLDAASVKPVTY